ncbi:MAG: PAS domain S-box protein [Verrucomicrobiales bacterium]|nr:PAS domain S-box protein [Verrucomicrobiales bacterium]
MPSRSNHHFCRVLGAAALNVALLCTFAPDALAASAPLTSVQQVIELGLESARSDPRAARFQAVVTYPSIDVRNRLYVQDAAAGIQVAANGLNFTPLPGQLVEVEGVTAAGPYYPFINQAKVSLLGSAPLPEPKRTSAAQLAAGADFAQWLALRGTIYDAAIRNGRLWLHAAADEHLFQVFVTLTPGQALPVDWRDAEIEFYGVPWIFYGANNTPSGFRFHVPGTNHLRILHSGRANVFDQPLKTARDLGRLPPGGGKRVRVSGVVTQFSPAGNFSLQDDTGSLRAQRLNTVLPDDHGGAFLDRPPQSTLQPGDRIEVVGAPSAQRAFAPLLLHAEYRLVDREAPPSPREISATEVRSGQHDGALVRLKGRLVDRAIRRAGSIVDQSLWLQDGNTLFEALLQTEQMVVLPGENNNLLEVTGACENQSTQLGSARSFRVHLRDVSDLRVLRTTPPLLSTAVVKVLGGAGGLMTLALGWVWLLRRQVARQTAATKASEERIRLIVDTALDAVITMDAKGVIRGWNAQAERTFGWTAAEAIGQRLDSTIIPPSHRDAYASGLQRFLATGQGMLMNKRIEVAALHRDGHEFAVELAITPLQMGDTWVFSGFARDITERKQAEARLRESEERFSRAFHGSSATLAILEAESGRYLDVNEAFVKAYGYSREEVLGRTSKELGLWEDLEQRAEAFRQYARDGRLRDFESRLRTRRGDLRVVLQSGDYIKLGDRNCILSVGIDITARKAAEIELLKNLAREKELGEMKTGFVSLVSHEFRTPLGVIMSATEVLQRYFDRLSAEKRARHLEMIFRSTKNLATLIEEVLVLGKVEEGRMQFTPAPIALESFCRTLADEVTSATNAVCPIQFHAAGSFDAAVSDESLLRHILTNLLSNAVKYSEPGTPVEFLIERRNGNAVFTVRDRGIGIATEDQERLFSSFTRGRNVGERPGSGLGLVIVQRCVTLHGGEIDLKSAPGKGTTVTVQLPVFDAPSSCENKNDPCGAIFQDTPRPASPRPEATLSSRPTERGRGEDFPKQNFAP